MSAHLIKYMYINEQKTFAIGEYGLVNSWKINPDLLENSWNFIFGICKNPVCVLWMQITFSDLKIFQTILICRHIYISSWQGCSLCLLDYYQQTFIQHAAAICHSFEMLVLLSKFPLLYSESRTDYNIHISE